jgi:hypothetical protein
MQLRTYFAVATLLVASVTRADDHFTNAGQTRRETSKPVASANPKPVASANPKPVASANPKPVAGATQQPKQLQPAASAEDLSTRAIDKGSVKLVQYSRALPGQQPVVDSPVPVQSQSFFGRIMELERRKNAWLLKTFLGRE